MKTVQIPKIMRAAVYRGIDDIRIETLPFLALARMNFS